MKQILRNRVGHQPHYSKTAWPTSVKLHSRLRHKQSYSFCKSWYIGSLEGPNLCNHWGKCSPYPMPTNFVWQSCCPASLHTVPDEPWDSSWPWRAMDAEWLLTGKNMGNTHKILKLLLQYKLLLSLGRVLPWKTEYRMGIFTRKDFPWNITSFLL